MIGRVEVTGQLSDLRFEFADREAAVRSVCDFLRGVLWGVFHGHTDTVFIYSIVAKSRPFSSDFLRKHREIIATNFRAVGPCAARLSRGGEPDDRQRQLVREVLKTSRTRTRTPAWSRTASCTPISLG